MGIRERKERERERRRQQIMVAAKRVFTEKGFSKATMEDIAKEAELSPGTLYLYFKNKDELYASLSLRILQYLMIRLEHVNAEPYVDATQRLDALKDAMFDVYEFDPLILINMFHMQSSETLKNLSADLLNQIETLSRNWRKVTHGRKRSCRNIRGANCGSLAGRRGTIIRRQNSSPRPT
jgi:AcrR family transcriptional regulator